MISMQDNFFKSANREVLLKTVLSSVIIKKCIKPTETTSILLRKGAQYEQC